MNKSERDEQRQEAIESLRALLPAGSTVYTCLMQVSRSGMSRSIKCLIPVDYADAFNKDPEIRNITRLVAAATGLRLSKDCAGVLIGGSGMDMGQHLVSSLSSLLRPPSFESLKQQWL